MLRNKLLTRLGLLVVMFVTGAVVSIVLLQGVLKDLDHMREEALTTRVQDLRAAVARWDAISGSDGADQGGAEAAKSAVRAALKELRPERAGADAGGEFGRALERAVPLVEARLGSVATEEEPLRTELAGLAAAASRHVTAEQSALVDHLRYLIIGLTIAALVSTNFAILVLLRTANMILRPVAELIEGSRALAEERYGYRVSVAQRDEFQELARAFNTLAEQMGANEERKVGALRQLAVTLNHEFNNIINAVELRLKLMDRRAGNDPRLALDLADIQQSLRRMSVTINSLQSVRRVALTDYMPGQLMLDLPKSIAPDEQVPAGAHVTIAPAAGAARGQEPMEAAR